MPLITQAARALEMVARYGSIRRAAERINAAPSAINRQILNLEAEFGVPLFERHPRGMHVTQSGQVLVDRIREWQSDDLRTRSLVETLKGSSGGVIRIGAMECLAADFLPRAFSKFQNIYPDGALDAIIGGTADIVALLMSGKIDLAIAFNLPRDQGLKITHEVRVPLGAVVSPGHPLSRKAKLRLEDIFQYPLALADNRLTIGPVVNTLLERSRKSLTRTIVSNSIAVLKSFAQRGEGVTILTSVDVYNEVKTKQLHFAPFDGSRMYELLSISVRDDKALPPNTKAMADILRNALDATGRQ